MKNFPQLTCRDYQAQTRNFCVIDLEDSVKTIPVFLAEIRKTHCLGYCHTWTTWDSETRPILMTVFGQNRHGV